MNGRVIPFVLLILTAALAAQTPKPVTVPITLDHNRTIIDVYLPLPDGQTKRVRAWVDNGNPEMLITQGLAAKLGLVSSSEQAPGSDKNETAVLPPASLQIGGMTIWFAGVKEAKSLARDTVAPGCSAEITIPSTVLRNYDVLFDFANRQFTIGPPRTIPFKGTHTKVLLNDQNGLIQVPSKVAGKDLNLALDIGASVSLISADQLAQSQKSNPSWPTMTGGVAAANMWGGDEETHWQVTRIPSLQFGAATLTNVATAAFPANEMKWFQNRAGVPTMGLVGANALVADRVGIDYANSTIYLERVNAASAPDMDVVGLMLRPEPAGRYTILGAADYEGKSSVPEVKAGDVLLGVDGAPATGATMGQVWSLLGGSPGQTRTLTLERDGKRLSVDATVRRFLPASQPPAKSARKNPHQRN
jgi:hypothetical protein